MKAKLEIVHPTAEEDAEIQRGIDADPDNPEWTDDDFRNARPASELMPAGLFRTGKTKAGDASVGEPVSIRLDADLAERLRATGAGWQRRANDFIRIGLDGPRVG